LRAALDEATDAVIATGGGIVCSPDAREDLAHEFTLWLDCDDEVILARLGDVERPLLAERPAEALAKLRAIESSGTAKFRVPGSTLQHHSTK